MKVVYVYIYIYLHIYICICDMVPRGYIHPKPPYTKYLELYFYAGSLKILYETKKEIRTKKEV